MNPFIIVQVNLFQCYFPENFTATKNTVRIDLLGTALLLQNQIITLFMVFLQYPLQTLSQYFLPCIVIGYVFIFPFIGPAWSAQT